MEKIPTAEEFFEQGGTYPELAIAFTKLHVERALKTASEEAELETYGSFGNSINKDSILNAYPLTLIK